MDGCGGGGGGDSRDPAVEGIYCKRPIQCLASSKILTPHPLTARRVKTPRLWCRGRTHSLGGGGWGVSSLEDARNCSVLNICKYFVDPANKRMNL
jgi:hypothetical protein